MPTIRSAKAMATRLRTQLAATGTDISHAQALELVAGQLGHRDWNTAAAALAERAPPGDPAGPTPTVIPILRTFPGEEARRFYVDFLGFEVRWEHRFDEGMPLYQEVARRACVLHLSEHHGDATPGSGVRIAVSDVRALRDELRANQTYPLHPGIVRQPWGPDLVVPDPFGNRLIFHQPTEPSPLSMVVARPAPGPRR